MKIESQDRRIDELLKGSTFFIPRFQRSYSWEADQVSQFWSDIVSSMGDSYFIGSMVVYKVGREKLAIVDGQQRLTTITILLCAIRDAFKRLGELELAKGLQAYIEQRNRENKTVYVLETETSFPFLQEEVLKDGEPEVSSDIGLEEEAIKRAFSMFNGYLSEETAKRLSNKEQTQEENVADARLWLVRLRDTIFDLNVILVTLDNEDDAYLIFETLNTRGKDLELADLLRNHFAKFIKPEAGVDQSNLKWRKVIDTIEGAPGKLDPDTFIVHSWQSRYDFVTKAKTFPLVKAKVTKETAKSHLNRFLSDAECWRSIFEPDYGWSKQEKEVSRSFAALRIFKVVQPAPGLLSLVRAYRDDIIKYKVLRDAVRDIEYFHFSFNAITSSRSSGGISGMYSSFGRQVFAAEDSNRVSIAIQELRQKLREREVQALEFDTGFSLLRYNKQSAAQKPLLQYILKKLAVHAKQPLVGHTDDLTIEHLVPQSSAKAGVSEDLIGQIGNLILVDGATNVKLGNNSYAVKKKILLDSGYYLPESFVEADDLTGDLIVARTRELSELARKEVWKV